MNRPTMQVCVNLTTLASLPASVAAAEVFRREDLGLRALPRTLRRLRGLRASSIVLFCRDAEHQHNRFFLRMVAAWSRARTVRFLDPSGRGWEATRAGNLAAGLARMAAASVYASAAAAAFFAAAAWLRLAGKGGGAGPAARTAAAAARGTAAGSGDRFLLYLKTDFWFGLSAGGSVTHTREFIRAGVESGWKIEVAAADSLAGYGLPVPVSVIPPSSLLRELPPAVSQVEYNLRLAAGVLRRLGGRRPALLYQRTSPYSLAGALLSRLLHVPLVLEYNNLPRWSGQLGSDVRGSWAEDRVDRLALGTARRIAVVSEELASALRARFPGPRVLVNPNGVDTEQFHPGVPPMDVPGLPAGCPVIGFIGMFAQYHGVLTLASCVRHVREREPSARFLVMGDGELGGEMREIIRRDGCEEAVHFAGVVAHADAPRYLSRCDILVSPHEDMADGSRFFGSPTKIFEYMAMGKPIVTTRAGQLGDIFQDRRSALLVQPRNPVDLARAIVELVRSPRLRETVGAEARRLAVSAYTWRANFHRVVDAVRAGPDAAAARAA